MGVNGYRMAHEPQHPDLLDALDENGIMVFAEIRRFESNEENFKAVEMTVKRDRNRPSIIMWSTGNEEIFYHPLPQGNKIHKAISAEIKKYDPYRPTTSCAARPEQCMDFYKDCDVISCNYRLNSLDEIHRKYPD